MVQKQVLKTGEKCIFRIQEANLDFYLVIPNNSKLHLVLGLMRHVTDMMVSNISLETDKAVVVPVFDDKILFGVQQGQVNYFDYLDKYFSALLNLAHKILVHNQLEVLNMIYFYSNVEYYSFRDWFIQKYNGRVQSTELNFQSSEVIVRPSVEQSEVVTPVAATFSGKVDIPVENGESVAEVPVVGVSSLEGENLEEGKLHSKEPGFVSYVLLGVIVAVLSLVFLYFIL